MLAYIRKCTVSFLTYATFYLHLQMYCFISDTCNSFDLRTESYQISFYKENSNETTLFSREVYNNEVRMEWFKNIEILRGLTERILGSVTCA